LNIISDKYYRKADIVNRGYSGYTTEWIKPVFESILNEEFCVIKNQVKMVTILFGSNDSALPHCDHHVPLNAFAFNLKYMIESVRVALPDAAILLVTPPPINEKDFIVTVKEKYGVDELTRTNESIKKYSEMISNLGQQLKIPVLNLWRVFDSEKNHLFTDGIHLSEQGNALLAEQWLDAVDAQFPKLMHTNLDFTFPLWTDIAKKVKSK